MKIKKFIKDNKTIIMIGFLVLSLVLTLVVSLHIDTDFFWNI